MLSKNILLSIIGVLAGIALFLLAYMGANMNIGSSLGLSMGGFATPLVIMFDKLPDK